MIGSHKLQQSLNIVIPDGCPALRRVEIRDQEGAPRVPDLRPG
jgi:hypothetical protein